MRRVAVDGPQELIDALDIKVTDKTLNLGLQSMTTVTIGNASYNIRSAPASSALVFSIEDSSRYAAPYCCPGTENECLNDVDISSKLGTCPSLACS